MKFLFVILILKLLCAPNYGFKILGLFPTVSKSHHIIGTALMKGLAERGHDITMISPFPAEQRLIGLKNFRDFVIEETYNQTKSMVDSIFEIVTTKNIMEVSSAFFDMGVQISNLTMQEPIVQKLLKSNEKFDLVICEMTLSEVLLGFGHRFKAPVVAVSTFGASMWTTDLVGSPSPLSYVPHPFLKFSDNMTLLNRIENIISSTYERVYFDNFYFPRQVALYNKHFPNPKPSLDELRRNVSLVLVNNHFTLSAPRPYVPNMIEVGGFHLNRTLKPLPNHIQAFLDSAKYGAIYFSLGAEVKSTNLRKETLSSILNVFKSLQQKVLFKWETWNLPGKPDNVLISDWFPQQDILAHPNLKLLITHGGLLSTMEAVYAGVPFIGIPLFGDQFLNMKFAEKSGIGVSMDLKELDEKNFKTAIENILEDRNYLLNIRELSIKYRDQPMQPLNTALYWIEYVLRHKGAAHMKSGGQDLSFIQYHNLDAFGILFGLIFLVLYLIWKLIMKCLCSGRNSGHQVDSHRRTKVSQKKIN